MGRNQMKLVKLFLLAITLCAGTIHAEPSPIDWRRVQERIGEYVASPSPLTAQAALETIPTTSTLITHSPQEVEANDAIYSPAFMKRLEKRVRMKEQKSVELAFRLRHMADGAFLEDLNAIIGRLIRISPQLFLSELARAEVPPKALEGLVANLGDKFVDQPKQQCIELRKRAAAIGGVRDTEVAKTKDQVLAALAASKRNCGRD